MQHLLAEIQANMHAQALASGSARQFEADSLNELAAVGERRGFYLADWCGQEACNRRVKTVTSATACNVPFDPPQRMPRCVACGGPAAHMVWFARTY